VLLYASEIDSYSPEIDEPYSLGIDEGFESDLSSHGSCDQENDVLYSGIEDIAAK
jgi:hypothetical protein